ncbi:CD166 antigen homolog isoform X2 [Osmerus eperlanus]
MTIIVNFVKFHKTLQRIINSTQNQLGSVPLARMHFSASFVGALFVATIYQVSGLSKIIGQYGTTIVVPCNNHGANSKDLFMTKWKYEKRDGSSGDLLVKKQDQNISIIATDDYKDRVSMDENSSLLISDVTLGDQTTFTCMIVEGNDIAEKPVQVVVQKAPSKLEISGQVEELEIGKLTTMGNCRAHNANPAADVTWFKNKRPLVADGKGIVVKTSVEVNSTTGLSTTSSILQYTAEKEDSDTQFTCVSHHPAGDDLATAPETFTVTYPTEKVSLEIISDGPVLEGDNVTLKCKADGNPPPTSFNFYIQGAVVKVENSDTYILTDVTRDSTGEYKCALIDNGNMEASENITVNYLDMSLSPSGKVVKSAGESLSLTLQTDASGEPKVSWTKDHKKLDKQPKFDKLTYSDSGLYECEVAIGTLVKKDSFEVVVEGPPVIRRLIKQRGEDGQHKVLVCEAEGSPKPSVAWSINGTLPYESSFINGKITHKLTIVPPVNLTVSCTVSNDLGQATKAINVSTLFEEVRMDKQDQSDENDQTKLVVGIVVGLLLATLIVGLAYWIYMKKSKQGTWKTGENEDGSSEESKKLEEKLEDNSQKAE